MLKTEQQLAPLAQIFPQAIVQGAVSRDQLRKIISADPSALQKIEAIVHPLVAEDRAAFVNATQADIVVFDIPLLFETGVMRQWTPRYVSLSLRKNRKTRYGARHDDACAIRANPCKTDA